MMTEKQLRDDIIVKMLDYIGKSDVIVNEFCETKKIAFSSDTQKTRIFEYLNNKKYIIYNFFPFDGGHFTITSIGINYARRLLIKKQKNRNALISITVDKGANHTPDLPTKEITVQLYSAIENKNKIIDNNIKACFNVEDLAECYAKLIDRACENEENNVCLFGIFAPWGRGKTYFFKKMKEYIDGRKSLKAMQYDIVEFNAWKYQETPAVWAYLFETLYNSKKWWFKFRYTIKRNINSIAFDFLIYTIPIILTALSTLLIKYATKNDYTSISVVVTSCISALGLTLKFIKKKFNSAISLIKKYSKGISFARELGIQAEIEKEITSLLKFWISEKETAKKKVILYIDDIDRCSETKMTSIIDSLRTVLENDEIRKRLIIICSIDPEKIIKGIEYKYNNLYDNKQIHSIAIDQMDKIFLTGIALPPLKNEQLLEYALKLTKAKDEKDQNTNQESQSSQNIDETKEDSIEPKEEINFKLELGNNEIYHQLEILIKNNKRQLTPRKIRIIYDRILLANNIICRMENPKITNALIQDIFNLSIGEKINHDETSNELSEVLNMVVPYKYQEEEYVKDKEGEVAIQS